MCVCEMQKTRLRETSVNGGGRLSRGERPERRGSEGGGSGGLAKAAVLNRRAGRAPCTLEENPFVIHRTWASLYPPCTVSPDLLTSPQVHTHPAATGSHSQAHSHTPHPRLCMCKQRTHNCTCTNTETAGSSHTYTYASCVPQTPCMTGHAFICMCMCTWPVQVIIIHIVTHTRVLP